MQKYQFFIIAIVAVGLIFYPGEHFLYTFEQMNESSFRAPSILPALSMPIPAVKTSALAPVLSAQGVYIVERNTFTTVFKKNPDTKLFPASTTKIITALATIQNHKLDDIITIKEATDEGQLMDLVSGERMSVENLLYGMLVYSANDAAYALAYSARSYPEFINSMNETAQKVGMRNSHFTNPAGLDELNQLTTPHDMALAAKALLENPTLRKMVSIKEITLLDEDFKYTHKLSNVNELLGDIEGLGGIKTGFTEGAGENLVSYFRTPYTGHEYIIVVMKSLDRFKDTRTITEWLTYNIDYLSP